MARAYSIDLRDRVVSAVASWTVASRHSMTSLPPWPSPMMPPDVWQLSRHRGAECDRSGGRDRQRRRLCPWARSRCLARPGAAADDDRRKATADGDQQTWQQILAQAAGAWRSGSLAFAVGEHETAREMAEGSPAAGAQEHGHCRTGEQAGADRLGGAAPWRNIRRRCADGGLIGTR